MRNVLVIAAVLLWGGCWETAVGQALFFEKEVASLLVRRCVECHQGEAASGGLDLTSADALQRGGDSGAVIDHQTREDSLLWLRVNDGDMPPEKQGQSQELSADEKAVLERWIQQGAGWPAGRVLDYFERTNDLRAGRDWWSLQPVRRPPVPPSDEAHPIDAFVVSRLKQQQMEMAPPADRRTLIRRLYNDLWGLPPTAAEVSAFENDPDPDAWTKLIDRMLDSPRYGERWGRHWLDLARYADTSGYERDQEKPYAWRYRDWVIQSIHQDMPYDEFVRLQIAGDQSENAQQDHVIATGFMRLGSWNDEPNDKEDYRYDRLEDLVHTTSSTFLGLTIKCARCHSHKFDPIRQEDYYRFAAAFWRGPLEPERPVERLGGPSADELGFSEVLGWTDVQSDPPPLHVLKNGERGHPLQPVVPQPISTISLKTLSEDQGSWSGYENARVGLAKWLTDEQQPLLDRVMVNRIWQHHFGEGLVRTPNNFGFLSDPPTHPELLDWLASEFRSQGRSWKAMHRLILTSRTWCQSSEHSKSSEYQLVDSGNRLWWHAERRRLDAETLRDSLLAVSGELDQRMGGPGFKPELSAEALEGLSMKGGAWQPSPHSEQNRRSVYMYIKRGLLSPMMSTFDLCDPTASCGKRDSTTVPTQSLALLNHRFVHQRSQRLAGQHVMKSADLEHQIRGVWQAVLLRQPSDEEMRLAIDHVQVQRKLIEKQSLALAQQQYTRRSDARLLLQLEAETAEVEKLADGTLLVKQVSDASGNGHHARPAAPDHAPRLSRDDWGQRDVMIFDGKNDHLEIQGQLLDSQTCTIVCVAMDDGGEGHRELISNWNGAAGNSVQSLFLGLSDGGKIRFSDAFSASVPEGGLSKPFLLTACMGEEVSIFWDGVRLATSGPLPKRRLDTGWVLGTQGNIQGEFWKGAIAEVRVYDRVVGSEELNAIHKELGQRYGIPLVDAEETGETDPDVLALASLAHVLMNSNEFLYVD